MTAELPARTVTVDWKPPGQLLVVSIVAEHAPVTGDGVTDGLVRGDGLVFGDGLVVGDGLVLGVAA
ncbi:hypothetical protein, partial [Microbispora rosea]|uniref:hypothetical protein n=1 Tax=Microbispora rosea TaxID=58117 RepID=UPI001EF2D1E2